MLNNQRLTLWSWSPPILWDGDSWHLTLSSTARPSVSGVQVAHGLGAALKKVAGIHHDLGNKDGDTMGTSWLTLFFGLSRGREIRIKEEVHWSRSSEEILVKGCQLLLPKWRAQWRVSLDPQGKSSRIRESLWITLRLDLFLLGYNFGYVGMLCRSHLWLFGDGIIWI